MKQRFCLLLLLLSGLVAAGDAPCSLQTVVGESCQLSITALHPTQSAVGELQVQATLTQLHQQPDIAAWQAKRPLPVAIGPDGTFFLLDGHHAARALWEIGAKQLQVTINNKFNNSTDFWQQMQTRHWVYLRDPHGQSITPVTLPAHIAELLDDPYRSLAGFARERGYFLKTDTFFVEFEWARYFGQALDWQAIDSTNLESMLLKAKLLACAPQASELPGYNAIACREASRPAQ